MVNWAQAWWLGQLLGAERERENQADIEQSWLDWTGNLGPLSSFIKIEWDATSLCKGQKHSFTILVNVNN